MSKTARDLMTRGAECVGENENLVTAARKMRDLEVGALPICGEDQRLKGMLTDRDIVISVSPKRPTHPPSAPASTARASR